MFSKVWFINIVLAVFIISVGFQAAGIWTQKERIPPQTKAFSEKGQMNPVRPRVAQRKNEPAAAYDLIVEQTLFSEDRAAFVPEAAITETDTDAPQVQASRQPVFLYGVVMVGDYRKALVREMNTRSGEDKWVYVGDQIAGMTVTAIEKEKLLLASASETVEVLLYDHAKPRRSLQVARADAPTVVTLSSSDAAPPGQSAANRQKAENQKPAEQEKPVKESTASGSDTEDVSAGSSKTAQSEPAAENAGTAPRQTSPFPPLPKQNQSAVQGEGGEYEVIQTPFGEIRRKIN